jgi:hypothetical protein
MHLAFRDKEQKKRTDALKKMGIYYPGEGGNFAINNSFISRGSLLSKYNPFRGIFKSIKSIRRPTPQVSSESVPP